MRERPETVRHLFDCKRRFDSIEGPEFDPHLAVGSRAMGDMAARDKFPIEKKPGAGR